MGDNPVCELNGGAYDGVTMRLPRPAPVTIVFHIGRWRDPGYHVVIYERDHPLDDPDVCTHHSYSPARPVSAGGLGDPRG